MTATDELHRLLDERGVKWNATVGASGTIWTHWDAFNGHRVHAMDNEDGTVEIFDQWDVTPEQAIAATLGADAKPTKAESSGTLTAEQVRDAVMSADRWKKPMGNTGLTNTHLIVRDDGWQAIADELNATLGSCNCSNDCTNGERTNGTCKLTMDGTDGCFGCSECLENIPPLANYCPNCGRRVEQ